VLGWVRQDLKLAAVLLDELGLEAVVKVGGCMSVSVEHLGYGMWSP
jgi:hypothetical protein